MKMTLNFISSVVATYLVIIFMSGIESGSFWNVVLVAVLLGVFNILVKPGLQMLSVIPTLITILLFLLVTNAAILIMADWLIDSFKVDNFGTAIFFSIIISAINWGLHRAFRKMDKTRRKK
ncbi:phage holin family protein [uncultured Bacteroides sp.]|uniref:phage holin family protein n=1 Tax=uncultured Bacteroides sp. TaxID=162156 RepID=UPI002AAB10D7|nr:phage holin family protein [uncultured Bacteroides sp.]